MKKDLLVHYSFALVYFFLITIFRQYLSFNYIAFWLGGIIGTVLPDIDHLIYVYILKPKDVQSQEVDGMIQAKKYKETWNYLVTTRQQRVGLIFHSAFFQLIFLAFTLYVATSSGSLFGKGLVLAFSLHIFIDMMVDYMDLKKIDNWFTDFPFKLDSRQRIWYMWGVGAVLLYLGFFL
jgi:hypothetical protein